MYIDYKITVWRRMKISSISSYDEIVKLVEENSTDNEFYSSQLYNHLENIGKEPYDDCIIDETEEPFSLNENNGCPTVEVFNDDDSMLYDNINGKYYE